MSRVKTRGSRLPTFLKSLVTEMLPSGIDMERTLLNRATFRTPSFSSRDLENRTFCSHLFLNGDYTRDESTEPFCNALGSGKTEPIHHRRDDYLCQ